MDFITIISLALIVSGVVSLIDWLFWSKSRKNKLESIRQKRRSIDYIESQKILLKPDFVVIANNVFGISLTITIIWLMLPNFELILVVALFLSLIVTLVEKLYVEKRKQRDLDELYKKTPNPHEQQVEDTKKMPWWTDYGWSFFPLLLAIVLLRSFFFEPFKIPSGSMKPTLWVHDFILVNKYAYGLRLPVTKTKITGGDTPRRGDVVVFRAPHQPDKDYIKRLIALPGDTVYYLPNQQVLIQPNCSTDSAKEHAAEVGLTCGVKNPISRKMISEQGFEGIDVYEEDLASVSHQSLIHRQALGIDRYNPIHLTKFRNLTSNGIEISKRQFYAQSGSYIHDWARGVIVPDDSFFVLGDNRTGSSDSRFWGFVPESMMVGKAEYVWLHLEFGLAETGLLSYIPTGINFGRMGSIE